MPRQLGMGGQRERRTRLIFKYFGGDRPYTGKIIELGMINES